MQETFALKFKTADQANKFKSIFEEAQKKYEKSSEAGAKKEEPKPTEVTKDKPLSDLSAFKPKEGSWECQGCFLRNSPDVTKCPSCETLKPGTQAPAITAAPGAPAFKFGSQGGFKFGSASPSTLTSVPATTGFGSGFNFTMNTHATSQTQLKPRSPNVSASSDNEYYEEDTGDHIHFEPAIPLPEKVKVKTGEEDEEVVYCHRAKLFRLSDGEWKERGLGDLKILKHKASGKSRLLMRREQILKICLNHALTPELHFRHKDDKSWLWVAQDYAEGEPKQETFVLRFKDAEVAKGFMKAIEENRCSTSSEKAPETKGNLRKNSYLLFTFWIKSILSVDVEVVFTKEATDEQKKKAKELRLPLNFFLYENAPPCPGCRGCEKDEDEVPSDESEPKSDASSVATLDTSSKATLSSTLSFVNMADSSVSNLSFSSFASNSASGFNKPNSFSWSGAGQPIFGVIKFVTVL